LLILVLAAAVTIAIAAAIFWWLWKKGRYGRVIAIAALTYVTYQIYVAVFPTSSFYRSEFAVRTGIEFPSSAKIIFTKSSYPDFHGDYAYEMLFEISPEDFQWLERTAADKLIPLTGDESIGGAFWRDSEAAYGKKMEVRVYRGLRNRKADQRGCWALLQDGKTVYFWFAQT